MIRVGIAGWSIPRAAAQEFPGSGAHLERYASVLSCAEINTSFYRDHAFQLYKKWSAQTPRGFRFSVKLPQHITHEQQLRRARAPLQSFFEQVGGLGRKLGAVLIQLPPSLEFDVRVARTFLDLLRNQYRGAVACEPRHPSWFEARAERVLSQHRIARVATDPSKITAAQKPGGWQGAGRGDKGMVYYRLHGSPRMYWSRYPTDRIRQWADEIAQLPKSTDVWCIFDNTASGAAIENALEIERCLPRT